MRPGTGVGPGRGRPAAFGGLAAALMVVCAGLGAGCLEETFIFACKTSDQCSSEGRPGMCEPSGYCSFSDDGCQSGRRYGRHAVAGRADQCTDCGNKVVDPGEECDDANDASDDACLPTCRWNVCGDGILRANVEECDDGNRVDGDSCSGTCLRCATGDAAFVWAENGFCYSRTDAPLSWEQAQGACSQRGAHLVAYNSEVEQIAVRGQLLTGTSTHYWVGLHDESGSGYSWVTNEPVVSPMRDFTSSPPRGLCASNQGASGAWKYLSCDTPRGFVCEDGGWVVDPRTRHAYRAVFNQPSWAIARDICPRWGGHLATVSDRDEQSFLNAHFFGSFWLGGTRVNPDGLGSWTWITGEPFAYTAFADGEPDNNVGDTCLAMGADRRWHDRLCDGSLRGPYGFICEVE